MAAPLGNSFGHRLSTPNSVWPAYYVCLHACITLLFSSLCETPAFSFLDNVGDVPAGLGTRVRLFPSAELPDASA